LRFIDAYGLVALVADEPAAAEVEKLLREGDCLVVAINLAEAVDVCQRAHGLPAADIRSALEPLLLSNALALAVSDETEAWLAAELRAKHYHRKQCPVSMADCFLLAHAIAANDDLATSDPDVAVIARAEGVQVIPLPDRSGARP
jgi:uncharacterized protein with PIN domain